VSSQELKTTEVHYPESDGKPMAETDIHRQLMIEAIESVAERFRDDPEFYVSGNLFLYYEEGDPGSVVSPDFFAVRGVPGRLRRTYKVWEEGKGPDIVLELTSRSTHREDLGNKRAVYEELGVKEYFIFDPEGIKFQPQLRAFRLKDGVLQPVPELRREGSCQVFLSEVLGLELHGGGMMLRWVDPATGEPLPSRRDLSEAARAARREAESEKARAESEKARAESEKAIAEKEKARAEAAEAELARLRSEIERQRGAGPSH
jgi:Uma2 family endonuclease